MLTKKWIGSLVLTLCLVITCATLAQQQQQNGGNNGNQVPQLTSQQRTESQLKTLLNVSDEEWAVIQPKIDKVQVLIQQRDRFINTKLSKPQSGQGNPTQAPATLVKTKPSNKDAPARTPNAIALDSYLRLATLVSSSPDSVAQIKASLDSYRAARKRSDEELLQARTDLQGLVTSEQEAILVLAGILD